MSIRSGSLLLASLLLLAACGGESDDTPPPSGNTGGSSGSGNTGGSGGSATGGTSGSGGSNGATGTIDEFLASYTELICTLVSPCCAAKGYDSSGKTCRSLFGSVDKSKYDVSAYDPAKGKKCLDDVKAVNSAGADCDGGFGVDPESFESCKGVLPPKDGNKAPGDTCESNAQCALVADYTETECVTDISFVEGGGTKETTYCRVERPGKEGEGPCTRTIDGNTSSSSGGSDTPLTKGVSCDVAQGLHCPTVGEKCARFLAAGESCTFNDRCVEGFTCKEGICASKAKDGEACQFSDDCVQGFTCDTTAKACKAKLAEGGACKSSDDCLGSCTNGVCKGSGGLEDLGYAFICGQKM
jgi:hypothetical protein